MWSSSNVAKNAGVHAVLRSSNIRGSYAGIVSEEEILAEVLRLPRAERARLAEEVLSNLEEPEE